MVRIGGGWCTLQQYLSKHKLTDPNDPNSTDAHRISPFDLLPMDTRASEVTPRTPSLRHQYQTHHRRSIGSLSNLYHHSHQPHNQSTSSLNIATTPTSVRLKQLNSRRRVSEGGVGNTATAIARGGFTALCALVPSTSPSPSYSSSTSSSNA